LEKLEKIYVLHTPRSIDVGETEGVIIDAGAGDDIRPLLSKYGEKVRQVHWHGNGSLPGFPFKGGKPVRKYFAATKEEVIRLSKPLKDYRWLVCPQFPIEKRQDVSFMTSMGIAVDLLYRVDDIEETVTADILKYYLHHRSLDVPVEPFHSVLIAKLEKKPLHLWSLHLLFPGLFVHVDDTAGEEKAVGKYLRSLPKTRPQCMSCAHFHFCFGWAKYQKDTCAKWKALLDLLQRNVREIGGFLTTKDTKDTKKKK
jgi:hypothetical protein